MNAQYVGKEIRTCACPSSRGSRFGHVKCAWGQSGRTAYCPAPAGPSFLTVDQQTCDRREIVYALGEKRWVRISVYVVRMRWFREVGKPSFLGTLKDKDLMNAIPDWFKKNAEWGKEQQ